MFSDETFWDVVVVLGLDELVFELVGLDEVEVLDLTEDVLVLSFSLVSVELGTVEVTLSISEELMSDEFERVDSLLPSVQAERVKTRIKARITAEIFLNFIFNHLLNRALFLCLNYTFNKGVCQYTNRCILC